jgi:penicillin G amidase
MTFLLRWFTRLFVVLAILVLLAASLAYYLARQSLPDYDGDYAVEDLDTGLEIVRDRYAIPHILARSDHDAFFGLGFTHAQDRLWQMVLLRRTAQGRLSELFGRETLEIDELMRALDIYGLSRKALPAQTEQVRADLEAYSEGVNAWLRVVQRDALGRGAPEFFLFDSAIAPWVPTDSIAIQKLMALRMTDKAARETLRARVSLRVPQERVRDLFPDAVGAPVMALPDTSTLFRNPKQDQGEPKPRHALYPIPEVGLGGASNAFAAASRRTATGAPLLASDPHLPLTAPSIFYLARLDLESGPVMGATIPGLPAVLIGRNEKLAWGLTSSYLDDQDIFIEKLDPDDPAKYLTPDGPRTFRRREAVISVRGQEAPERRELRWTRHGPVIPADHFGASAVTPPGHVAALAWTGFLVEDRSVGAAIALMRAGSIDAARDAARDLVAPSNMVTLADSETVALQMAGAAPQRDPRHTSQGRIPAPGWLAVNDWQGMRPFAENPWVINPRSGVVVNTNNRITDGLFPDHLSFDWGDSMRIARAVRLLGARQYHTLDSFIEIQTDTVSEAARALLPLIARDLWYSDEAAESGSEGERRRIALERLADWSGEMSEHDPEPLIYAAWVRALERRLVVDELGALAELMRRPDPAFIERVFRNVDGAGNWCDVIQTSDTETCADISSRALDDALVELTDRFGGRLESWRWGDAHQALHQNETLGRIPVLGMLANIWQSIPGGDHTLLRGVTAARGAFPYESGHAAAYRNVTDFADPNASVFILSTGESGHILSRHYDDLAALWRRAEYVPMSFDVSLARASAEGTTRLSPLR